MEIKITGTPKEIAALVREIQEQLGEGESFMGFINKHPEFLLPPEERYQSSSAKQEQQDSNKKTKSLKFDEEAFWDGIKKGLGLSSKLCIKWVREPWTNNYIGIVTYKNSKKEYSIKHKPYSTDYSILVSDNNMQQKEKN